MLFAFTVFVYALNSLWVVCQAVPLLDLRNTLEQNVLDAMITSACSSNGECWEWLPVQEVHENIATEPDNLPIPKYLSFTISLYQLLRNKILRNQFL